MPLLVILSLWRSLPLLLLASPAAAHNDPLADNPWLSWPISLDLAIPLAVAIYIYARGAIKRRGRCASVTSGLEPALVALGFLAIFLALQSPIDPLAERSFSMHQIQHLLLRSVGPLLLFLPAPQATFLAGLSSRGRRFLGKLGYLAGSRALGLFLHPFSVMVMFIASAYIWQYPPYFELALRNDAVHYLMHVTMLVAGMLFWWRIFDNRKLATSYGMRLAMLWIATTANIALGAYLTFKGGVLYPAYDEMGRLWLDNETDELLGGLIVWVLGSKMFLIPFLVIVRRWGYRESLRKNIKRMVGLNVEKNERRETTKLALRLGIFSGGVYFTLLTVAALYLVIR